MKDQPRETEPPANLVGGFSLCAADELNIALPEGMDIIPVIRCGTGRGVARRALRAFDVVATQGWLGFARERKLRCRARNHRCAQIESRRFDAPPVRAENQFCVI